MKKIKENIVPLFEIIAVGISIFLPTFLNLEVLFQRYLTENYPTPENAVYYLVLNRGNIITGLIIALLVLWRIRSHNKDLLFNRENVYHDYPYIWYCICAKVLGIRKCNLVNVPIYMQFRLVVHQTFDAYPLDDLDYPESDNEINGIEHFHENKKDTCNECNLILEDTYTIATTQIPYKKKDFFTVKVSRNDGKTVSRHFSQQFIDAVINETRALPTGVTVNVFATTNPKNTLNIAKRVFTMADRGNIAHVFVFQQRCDNERVFESSGKKLY